MARVTLVSNEQASPEVQEVFQRLGARGARVLNIYRAMAHSPEAMRHFLRLGNVLLARPHLDQRLRELAILRIAKLTGSTYEWAQHVPIALASGVTQEQMDAMGAWRDSAAFDARDRAVLAYVDEVTQQVRAQDATFQELSRHLDQTSIVELTLSIGFWGMVARFLEALQVDVDIPTSAHDVLGRPR